MVPKGGTAERNGISFAKSIAKLSLWFRIDFDGTGKYIECSAQRV